VEFHKAQYYDPIRRSLGLLSPVWLCALLEWSDKCLFQLNASKCKSVYYGRNINRNYAYYLPSTELENVNVIKDLKVVFDPYLAYNISNVLYCKENINNLYGLSTLWVEPLNCRVRVDLCYGKCDRVYFDVSHGPIYSPITT